MSLPATPDPGSMEGSESAVPTQRLLSEMDRGDPGAARELIGRYRPVLLARAARHRWMPVVAPHMTAEDAVQEVFCRAIGSGLFSAREGCPSGSLLRALHVVLERVLADQLRRLGSARHGAEVAQVSLDSSAREAGSPLFAQLASPSTTPTVSARSAELIRLCQAHLDDREWEVWRLRVIAGLDFDEIAALDDSSPAAARGLMHRARKKLILALAELDPGHPTGLATP